MKKGTIYRVSLAWEGIAFWRLRSDGTSRPKRPSSDDLLLYCETKKEAMMYGFAYTLYFLDLKNNEKITMTLRNASEIKEWVGSRLDKVDQNG